MASDSVDSTTSGQSIKSAKNFSQEKWLPVRNLCSFHDIDILLPLARALPIFLLEGVSIDVFGFINRTWIYVARIMHKL